VVEYLLVFFHVGFFFFMPVVEEMRGENDRADRGSRGREHESGNGFR
jgi:hypothetical protein